MVGESGGSAERKAAELRAGGKRSAGAWAAGAEGERRVAEALTQLPPEWLVLHDRLLMPGLAESNLDHLLVGPAGVILIDAKNWAGQIGEWEGSVFQHKWRANGGRVHRPVDREFAGVAGMATEVARRINHRVIAVICLAGRTADQFGEPRLVKNVWVVPVSRLVEWLNARPHVDDRTPRSVGRAGTHRVPFDHDGCRAAVGHGPRPEGSPRSAGPRFSSPGHGTSFHGGADGTSRSHCQSHAAPSQAAQIPAPAPDRPAPHRPAPRRAPVRSRVSRSFRRRS